MKIQDAFEEYRGKSGWKGLDAEAAVESFVRFYEARENQTQEAEQARRGRCTLDIDPRAFEAQFQWLLTQSDQIHSDALEGLLGMMGGMRDQMESQGIEIRLPGEADLGDPMQDFVRDWYMAAYPSDNLGDQINPYLTFQEAYDGIRDIYGALGVGDSFVRECVFTELSKRMDADYDDIYDRWLGIASRATKDGLEDLPAAEIEGADLEDVANERPGSLESPHPQPPAKQADREA